MGSLQNFYTSRDNNTDPDTYVGQLDRLWYNPVTNSIFVSDGTTPGGVPVALATGANIVADNIALNSITARSGNVTFDGNLVLNGWAEIAGNISPAATNKIGGIAPGPGVVVSNEGFLTIDTANLPLSFGNFTASNNVLSITNVDEDMILQTEGSAEIQLVGNIGFYKPDGIPPNPANRFAFFNSDGQATFYIPVTDPAEGAVKIIGSTTGNFTAPLNTGVMLQVTGQNNDASRIYNDSIGGFAALVGRRLNGTTGSPTPVLNNEELMRLTAVAHNGTAFPTGAGQRITYRALGTQSLTNGGGAIEFWTTPLNSTTIGQVATVDTANGVNATKFTTSGTVSATGNITGGNIVTAGTVNSAGTIGATGNVSGGNITTVGVMSATGNIITAGYFVGNGAAITGINAFGNIYANGVAILATSGSSSLTMTPGNNVVILGDNGTKTATISVKDAPSFTGNVTVGGVMRYDQAVNNATGSGFNKTGGTVTANGRTGQITSNADAIAKGAAGTFTINNNYITSAKDIVIINIASGASVNSYAVAVTAINSAGSCNVTVSNNGTGSLSEALVFNFAVIKVS